MLQARNLIEAGPGRPRQTNLRRAVSDCYYAVFHALTERSAKLIVSGSKREAYRRYVRRGYSHGQVRQVCIRFRIVPSLQTARRSVTANMPLNLEQVSPDLRNLAERFIDLQELRHTADYDHAYEFYKEDTEAIFRNAVLTLALIEALDPAPEPDFAFLLALYAHGNRPNTD